MPESAPSYRPVNAIILMVLYAALFAMFVYLLLSRPEVLAAEDLPISDNSELHLFGANCAILYTIALLITPVLIAGAYVSTGDRQPKPKSSVPQKPTPSAM